MQTTAQRVFKELSQGDWQKVYLVSGEELFQQEEVKQRFRSYFIKDPDEVTFCFEKFDLDSANGEKLTSCLGSSGDLFGSSSPRLVFGMRLEKISSTNLNILQNYFENLADDICLVLFAAKVDKRKAWFKSIPDKTYQLEFKEPSEREWPKWHRFMEKKLNKQIDPSVWELCVNGSEKKLAVLWKEMEKLSTFVGKREKITEQDVVHFVYGETDSNIFQFLNDWMCKKYFTAMNAYYQMIQLGEPEVKILSLLVRQYRLIFQYLQAKRKMGAVDNKTVASQLGVHPFVVTKLAEQAKHQSIQEATSGLQTLAECDYRVKTGIGSVLNDFLIPRSCNLSYTPSN